MVLNTERHLGLLRARTVHRCSEFEMEVIGIDYLDPNSMKK
jgi:hypothetical protein